MTDIGDKQKRSAVMSRIRSQGNKATELRLIAIFRAARMTGWRRKQPLIGKPDFVFRKQRLAVFVDGCFWHGCPKCYRRPASNQTYWEEKVQRNRSRDRQVTRELRQAGWRVLRIWEHQLAAKTVGRLIQRLCHALQFVVQKRNQKAAKHRE